MAREIDFFERANGKCPTIDFISSLDRKIQRKIEFIFKIVEDFQIVPSEYLKNINRDIYEIRVQLSGNIYRFLCFFYKGNIIVVTHGFQKKTQKTPMKEITRAEALRKEYLLYRGDKKMLLKEYLENKYDTQEEKDSFDEEYREFRLGVLLKEERKKLKMTQEEVAKKMGTKKEAISRLENHIENIKIETLIKYASALGKRVSITLEPPS